MIGRDPGRIFQLEGELSASRPINRAAVRELLELLRSKGLMHTDRSIEAQIYMVSAISMGFIIIDQFLLDKYRFSPEEAADMLAETIRRTFEERQPISLEQQEIVAEFGHAIENIRALHTE